MLRSLGILGAAALASLAMAGCGGDESTTVTQEAAPASVHKSTAAERCVELWNTKPFSETLGGSEGLAERILLRIEGQAIVIEDDAGICVVGFPESAGGSPGSMNGSAFAFSYERGDWDLYLFINHEEAPIDPAAAEARRPAVEARANLMLELNEMVEVSPNAQLQSTGELELLDEGAVSESAEPPEAEEGEVDGEAPQVSASDCESVAFVPQSDVAAVDISVGGGATCPEVEADLLAWYAGEYQGDPGDFDCEGIPTTTGLTGTIYHCVDGDKVLEFVSH